MPTTTSRSPATQPDGTWLACCIFSLVFGSAAFTHLLKCCEITEVLKEGNVFVGMKCVWQSRANLGFGGSSLHSEVLLRFHRQWPLPQSGSLVKFHDILIMKPFPHLLLQVEVMVNVENQTFPLLVIVVI